MSLDLTRIEHLPLNDTGKALLEEVKRLRQENEILRESLQYGLSRLMVLAKGTEMETLEAEIQEAERRLCSLAPVKGDL